MDKHSWLAIPSMMKTRPQIWSPYSKKFRISTQSVTVVEASQPQSSLSPARSLKSIANGSPTRDLELASSWKFTKCSYHHLHHHPGWSRTLEQAAAEDLVQYTCECPDVNSRVPGRDLGRSDPGGRVKDFWVHPERTLSEIDNMHWLGTNKVL